ncbi:MAG: NAD(P)/FAD-dependent oxidoreductase [Proteobacteria bacterium]|nr:NAD(P)/FAD-dependent oxidoreductase [Pseudomonadota bacterium]
MAGSGHERRRRLSGRELGTDRPIPRRDFLQGTLVGAATALTGSLLQGVTQAAAALLPGAAHAGTGSGAAQDRPGYYPPRLTGLRGSHPGSFEAAHALRDGHAAGAGRDTGERYDLVVVGGGISGLAAAQFFRELAGSAARVLILDNHDDFGGHARRNEFLLDGQVQLCNGGTLEIDSPRPYSAVALGLLRRLGLADIEALARRVEHKDFYEKQGLAPAAFFDAETFGSDALVVGLNYAPQTLDGASLTRILRTAPLSAQARADLMRVEVDSIDYLPGMSAAQKKDRLSRTSYLAYLRDLARVDPAVLAYYQARTHAEWGVGIDAIAALDCWGFGLPGFRGLNLPSGSIPRMGFTPSGYMDTGGSATLHFPDGNATIARLLVRHLIPQAASGHGVEDIVTARFDYSRLDRPGQPVRLRLSSTAVRVRHRGDPATAREVEVTYVRAGETLRVSAGRCVLAGYNMMIPYLCPELPQAQRAALHSLVKTPLVYTTVALRNWQAFRKLGIWRVYSPGCYHSSFLLNPNVDIGSYRSVTDPGRAVLIRMTRTPCRPGLPEMQQNRAGRAELLNTSFETFEHRIREQLQRTLGPGGFEAARDITAITVNRWPHGYAHEYNSLWEPQIADTPVGQRPNVIARTPFGRIAIANSDSGAAAYTDCAIDQAHRAVGELWRT